MQTDKPKLGLTARIFIGMLVGIVMVSCIVAKSEGELDEQVYRDPNAGVSE